MEQVSPLSPGHASDDVPVGNAVHRSRIERGRGMRAGDDALARRAMLSHVTATTRELSPGHASDDVPELSPPLGGQVAAGLTHLEEPFGCLGRLHVDPHLSPLANPLAFSTPQPGRSYNTLSKGATARCPRNAQCSEGMARVSGGGRDVTRVSRVARGRRLPLSSPGHALSEIDGPRGRRADSGHLSSSCDRRAMGSPNRGRLHARP